MFKYEKEYYDVRDEEDEAFYKIMFSQVFAIFSPFEVDDNVDFPKKEELGGVVLKFIGGGSAYFKVQREMPSDEEVNSILEVCRFLKESFGEYFVAYIICEPHIEIRDIKLTDPEIDLTFVSSRKNDGDMILERLTKKLQENKKFTKDDFVLMLTVPFMGRWDNEKFQKNYSRFIELYKKSDLELPKDLTNSNIEVLRIF